MARYRFHCTNGSDCVFDAKGTDICNSGKTGGGSVVFASLTRLPLILWRDGSTG